MNVIERRYWQVLILAFVVVFLVLAIRIYRVESPSLVLALFLFPLIAAMAAVFTAIMIGAPLRIVLNLAFSERRRTKIKETAAIAAVLVLFWAWIFEVSRELRSLAPRQGADTLDEFIAHMPAPQQLEHFDADGQQFIGWTGNMAMPLAFVSGPSLYVFDHRGKLVVWQPATGDGGPAEALRERGTGHKFISVPEALDLTRRKE